MSLLRILIVTLFVLTCQGMPIENKQKNITCRGVTFNGMYKYTHGCPKGSEISVSNDNQTLVAYFDPTKSKFATQPDVTMDTDSVTTRYCQNLTIKCIQMDGGTIIREIIVNFVALPEAPHADDHRTEDPESSDSPLQRGLIVAAVITVVGVFTLSIGFLLWKRKNQTGTFGGFIRHILNCSWRATGNPCGNHDINSQQHISLQIVQSTDPAPDAMAPPSQSLIQNLSLESSEASTNGDVRGSGGPSNHRAMYRNLRDDPGGVDETTGRDFQGDMDAADDQKAKDQKTEEQPLLPDQRAASQDFDMKGEANALVNKRSFDPGQLSKCSVGPGDVESTSNEELIIKLQQ